MVRAINKTPRVSRRNKNRVKRFDIRPTNKNGVQITKYILNKNLKKIVLNILTFFDTEQSYYIFQIFHGPTL